MARNPRRPIWPSTTAITSTTSRRCDLSGHWNPRFGEKRPLGLQPRRHSQLCDNFLVPPLRPTGATRGGTLCGRSAPLCVPLVDPSGARSPRRRDADTREPRYVQGKIPPALDIPAGLGKTAVMAICLIARLAMLTAILNAGAQVSSCGRRSPRGGVSSDERRHSRQPLMPDAPPTRSVPPARAASGLGCRA